MKKWELAVDYRKLRPSNLNTPEFSHLLMLLFWPLYGIVFFTLEQLLDLEYHVMYSFIDDFIPFCEFFVIPYYFWFVFMIGMLVYSFLFNIDTFRKYMKFIIISNSITLLLYFIFPTSQELRPTEFARDNIFVDIVRMLYDFDTNTNVCPSLHVINSFAVCFAAWHDKNFKKPSWRCFFACSTVLISISTVMLKQHSIIDVAVAVILCVLVYPFVWKKRNN